MSFITVQLRHSIFSFSLHPDFLSAVLFSVSISLFDRCLISFPRPLLSQFRLEIIGIIIEYRLSDSEFAKRDHTNQQSLRYHSVQKVFNTMKKPNRFNVFQILLQKNNERCRSHAKLKLSKLSKSRIRFDIFVSQTNIEILSNI